MRNVLENDFYPVFLSPDAFNQLVKVGGEAARQLVESWTSNKCDLMPAFTLCWTLDDLKAQIAAVLRNETSVEEDLMQTVLEQLCQKLNYDDSFLEQLCELINSTIEDIAYKLSEN